MEFFITSDSIQGDSLSWYVLKVSQITLEHFQQKDYGTELAGICIVLFCRRDVAKFKLRPRLSKKDKTFYSDLQFEYASTVALGQRALVETINRRICSELPPLLAKRKIVDFDLETFVKDLAEWFAQDFADPRPWMPGGKEY